MKNKGPCDGLVDVRLYIVIGWMNLDEKKSYRRGFVKVNRKVMFVQ